MTEHDAVGSAELEVEVRPAVDHDEAALGELWDRVAGELRGFRGGDDLVGSIVLDPPGGGSATSLRLVAEVGGVVVGGLVAVLEQRGATEPVCVVQALATDPELRGVGVGHRLLGAVDAWVDQQGAGSVEVVALPGDRATKNFLEAHGLVAHLLVTRRAVDDRDGR